MPDSEASRSSDELLRLENDDLRTATSRNSSIVLDLSLDGVVRYLSRNWEDLIGTSIDKIIGSPISDVIVGNEDDKRAFDRAISTIAQEDTSFRIRFLTRIGPLSIDEDRTSTPSPQGGSTRTSPIQRMTRTEQQLGYSGGEIKDENTSSDIFTSSTASLENDTSNDEDYGFCVELEGQGILIKEDDNIPPHTMWILHPYEAPESLKIDLPDGLQETLMDGAQFLVSFLEELSDSIIMGLDAIPAPPLELCRICERNVPKWWFEGHCELCAVESKSESAVQIAHEALVEHRSTLSSLAAEFEAAFGMHSYASTQSSTGLSRLGSPESMTGSDSENALNIQYRGHRLRLTQLRSPDLPSMSPPASPRLSSTQGLLMKRNIGRVASPPSFKRSPLKLIELLLGLCDMALEVKTPEVKYTNIPDENDREASDNLQIRTFSPVSEARIHQVLDWSYSQNNDDAGMALLFQDTAEAARRKVEAAMRLGSMLIYSERIRLEMESMVQQAIKDTVNRSVATVEGITDDDDDKFQADDERNDKKHHEMENESMESDVGDTTVIIHQKTESEPPSSEYLSAQDIFSDSYLHKNFPGEAKKMTHQSSSLRLSPLQLPASSSPRLENLLLEETPNERRKTVPRIITEQRSPLVRHSVGNIQSGNKKNSQSDGLWVSPSADSHRTHLSISDTSSFTSVNNDDFGIGDLDLNLSSSSPGPESPISVTGSISMHGNRARKSFSSANVSPKMYASSPLSSLHHRRHLTQSMGASFGDAALSPLSQANSASPLLFPHDYDRHHRRQSSIALDFSRAPVSPLLTASVPPPRPVPSSINDYEIVCPISKGAFGSVYLSRKKLTGEYFAIKVLRKADMIAKNQVMNVKSERAIMMAQEDSPFVAKLFFTFQNKDYLFLVMEYLNGGDCAALLKVLGGLPEKWTQKYIAEVVVAVDELHKRGIVHRDLKPENLLIDSKGHLKLIDFGLSQMGAVGRQTKQTERARSRTATKHEASDGRESSLTRDISRDTIVSNSSNSGSSGTSSTPTGVLHDPNISLVPGYFSLGTEEGRFVRPHPAESSGSEGTESGSASISGSQTAQSILYDPKSGGQPISKFVGTPDYLSPETIRGHGLAEMSDWWSLGCILFEFLYGYPPFHAPSPSLVFQNILDRNIQWPSPGEECDEEGEPIASEAAKDLINKLLATDPTVRLGVNGAEEIKDHPFFKGIVNWDSLWDGEASFIPQVEHPEDTDYFDSRGAAMQSFETDIFTDKTEQQISQQSVSVDSSDESSQSGSGHRVSGSSPMARGSTKPPRPLPLHIPPHVREGRSRRLSEPVPVNDFGSFSYKNLPVLEKANKELIFKMKQESVDHYREGSRGKNRLGSIALPLQTMSGGSSPSPTTSRHTSPTRQLSSSSSQRHGSSVSSSSLASPQKMPVLRPNIDESELVSFSDRFKGDTGISPVRVDSKKDNLETEKTGVHLRRPSVTRAISISNIRHGSVFDVSPSASDTEDSRVSSSAAALLRIQKRRVLSRKMSRSSMSSMRTGSAESGGVEIPILDILICDVNPVWRYSTERMLHKAGCRVVSVSSGQEALRRATGTVRFDVIFLDFKLGGLTASDVCRLIRQTENPNTDTPIVCLTSSSELQENVRKKFNGQITRPPTEEKLVGALKDLFPAWKPARSKEPKKSTKDGDAWLPV